MLEIPTGPQVTREARPDYTLLTISRFFAALWVVFLHLYVLMPEALRGSSLISRIPFFKLGFLGVTFFFVLSGFILGKLYPGNVHKKSFYLKRFLRIYPSYFIVLAFLCFKPILAFPRTFAYCAPVFLLFNAWIPSASQNMLGPAWSLTCEAFFYLIYPFVSLAILGKGIKATWFVIALTFVPVAVGIYMAAGQRGIEAVQNSKIIFFPLVHVPSFLIGILFAKFKLVPKRTFVVSIACICFAFLVKLIYRDLVPLLMGIMAIPFAALIWALAGEKQPDPKGKVTSFFLLLGNASYVLYLVHLPILVAFRWRGYFDSDRGMALAAISSIIFSVVFYLLLDKPIHDLATKWMKKQRTA